MKILIIALVGLASGIIASMGLGGGMILILYLTLILDMPQIKAQGINIVFFLPIAVMALIIHTKNHLVEWKKIIPAIITGIIIVALGSLLALNMSSEILTKLFAGFIIIIGIREFFTKAK